MTSSSRFDRVSEMMEELLAREERYEVFLNASPWGILVVDQTFIIVFANQTLQRMTGYSVGEMVGRHMHMLLPLEDIKRHVPHEKNYVKNPTNRIGNHGLDPRILTKAGNILPVEISLSPTSIQGQSFFFASIRERETLKNTDV